MTAVWIFRPFAVLIAALVLALAAAPVARPAVSATVPPAEPQGQSFAVAPGSPLAAAGHPADILGAGGAPMIPCAYLGLLCSDPATGANDHIAGLSYGWDFVAIGLPALEFSVGQGAQGVAGTAVRTEASCNPAEPQADVFDTALDGTNFQDLDGNGIACGANVGLSLGLSEGVATDNLDNLERDPCQFVDLNCDGVPDQPIFLTLASGSPSLGMIGATPADIIVMSGGSAAEVWARGTADLGLRSGDAIDALCLRENGDGVYNGWDEVLLSLAPASPTLTALGAGPADLLRPSPVTVGYRAAALGLQTTDNVDALACSFDASRVALPMIER